MRPALLAAGASAAVLRASRRSSCWRLAAATGDAQAAEPARPLRRRRRRKQPPTSDAAEAVRPDCGLIVDTVVEVGGLVSDTECEVLIQAAQRRTDSVGWGAGSHASYPTEDVKVWSLSRVAKQVYQDKIEAPVLDIVAEQFRLPRSKVFVDDAFVVRYQEGHQTSLDFHRDGSVVSAIVSLSKPTDYEGGGTAFKDGTVYRPERGCGIAFGGQRLHSGIQITSGSRYICTMFMRCGGLCCRDVAVAKDELLQGGGGGGFLDGLAGVFGG